MKHLILIPVLTASLMLPTVAQPQEPAGGPVQLHNPHRRGDAPRPVGGGGFMPDGNGFLPDGNGFMPGGNGFNTNGFGSPGLAAETSPPTPPSVAMFVDGPYLFVLRGDSLYQFDKKTLKLLNSTELPKPVVPAPPTTTPAIPPAQDNIRTHTSPPLRPGPNF